MSESWVDAKAYGFCNDIREELSELTLRCIKLEQENAELRAEIEKPTDDGWKRSLDKMQKKNNELRAQLARCVDKLTKVCPDLSNDCIHACATDVDCDFCGIKSLLNSLPKTAALDAEILQCANEWVFAKCGETIIEAGISLYEAVIAQEEATK